MCKDILEMGVSLGYLKQKEKEFKVQKTNCKPKMKLSGLDYYIAPASLNHVP